MASRLAATVALPGPSEPLAPGRPRATHARVPPGPDTPNFNTRARAAARYQRQGRPQSPGRSAPVTPLPKGLTTGGGGRGEREDTGRRRFPRVYRKPAECRDQGTGVPWSPHCCAPPRAVQLRPGCEAWCGAPGTRGSVCARSRRAPRDWHAGPVIWGSESRHLCRWHGPVFQRKREEGRRPDGGGDQRKGPNLFLWHANLTPFLPVWHQEREVAFSCLYGHIHLLSVLSLAGASQGLTAADTGTWEVQPKGTGPTGLREPSRRVKNGSRANRHCKDKGSSNDPHPY
ncbi:uncharacterized protein LOC103663228 [Ursus maritimus]|uniref:Uncharacterized protein LOC103663228 n=1 Tax=Ursus maritimus TaxID=29073 RepID=A0A8M1EYB8_URSMA|nr:uncharacterized protein LOC103663228 [Ursus maritimus]